MFKSKKQAKFIVEFQLDFNLTNAKKWIKDGSNIEDLGKKKADWYKSEEEFGILHPVIQSYVIDVVPTNPGIDMYFHRKANRIGNNIGGIDYLGNLDNEEIKFACKDAGINSIEWGSWREFFTASINGKVCIMTPLDKIVELQVLGKLENASFVGQTRMNGEKVPINVPIAYNEDGSIKATTTVWHGTASMNSVGYMNEIASVSANTLNFEIEY